MTLATTHAQPCSSPPRTLSPAPFLHDGASDGIAVIMLHGLTASPTEVLPIAQYFREVRPEFTLSCPLLPGHGTTPEQLRATTAEAWIQAVQSEVERVSRHCRSVSLIGVSMGAVLAAHIACHDARVRSVAMLAPMFAFRASARFLLPWLRYVKPYLSKSAQSIDNHRRKGLYSYDRYPVDSLNALRRLARRVRAGLGELRVPTLIAAGRKDRYLPWSILEQLCREVGSERVEKVECDHSGHVLPHEPDAPRLFKALDRFIGLAHGVD